MHVIVFFGLRSLIHLLYFMLFKSFIFMRQCYDMYHLFRLCSLMAVWWKKVPVVQPKGLKKKKVPSRYRDINTNWSVVGNQGIDPAQPRVSSLYLWKNSNFARQTANSWHVQNVFLMTEATDTVPQKYSNRHWVAAQNSSDLCFQSLWSIHLIWCHHSYVAADS